MKLLFIGDLSRIRFRRWVEYMKRHDNEVTVLTVKPGEVSGVKVITIDPGDNDSGFKRALKRWNFIVRELLLILFNRYDIVHIQYLRPDWSALIGTLHPRSIISVWGKEVLILDDDASKQLWNSKKIALHRAKIVTTVHQIIEQQIKKHAPLVRKVEIIPFGADVRRFGRLKRIVGGLSNEVRFCYARPIEHEYQPEMLISAFIHTAKRYPNVTLAIIGVGNQKLIEQLMSLIRTQGLYRKVYFAGKVTDAEMDAIFERSDVLIDLSKWDAWGVVVMEALAAGLPVIAPRVGGLSDVILDEVTGLTFPPDDLTSLVKSMMRMVEEQQLREYMSRNAREMAGKLYSFSMHAERMIALYQKLQPNKHSKDPDPQTAQVKSKVQ